MCDGAAGLDGFFATAAGGLDLQAPVPLDRWDLEAWYAPEVPPRRMTSYTRFGAFCQDVAQFEVRLILKSAGDPCESNIWYLGSYENAFWVRHRRKLNLKMSKSAASLAAAGFCLLVLLFGINGSRRALS